MPIRAGTRCFRPATNLGVPGQEHTSTSVAPRGSLFHTVETTLRTSHITTGHAPALSCLRPSPHTLLDSTPSRGLYPLYPYPQQAWTRVGSVPPVRAEWTARKYGPLMKLQLGTHTSSQSVSSSISSHLTQPFGPCAPMPPCRWLVATGSVAAIPPTRSRPASCAKWLAMLRPSGFVYIEIIPRAANTPPIYRPFSVCQRFGLDLTTPACQE